MAEAIERLQADGIAVDTLRIRAFPFPESVRGFIDAHESVFVVEQNRDGQLRSLLVNEFGIDPARLVAVRSEEHTSELQSLMRTSSAVFCMKNKKRQTTPSER